MRINRLERQLQNIERMNNNRNRNQPIQREYNKAPINYDEVICFKCNRRGHFATRCPIRNNFQGNNRRINLMDIKEEEDGDNDEYDDDESSEDDNELYQLTY